MIASSMDMVSRVGPGFFMGCWLRIPLAAARGTRPLLPVSHRPSRAFRRPPHLAHESHPPCERVVDDRVHPSHGATSPLKEGSKQTSRPRSRTLPTRGNDKKQMYQRTWDYARA